MIVRKHFEVGETAVTILAEEDLHHFAHEAIFQARHDIERFIAEDPFFQLTFEPYQAPRDAPEIVKRMCRAGQVAGVGPMAAVAGAIAEVALQAMINEGAEHAMVDNGGDIALNLREETTIGIYPGASMFQGYGYLVPPTSASYGICTSSGTVGPSISLGVADAATVFAKDVALADACATALGNLVVDSDEDVLKEAVKIISNLPGVDGCAIMVGGMMAMRGKVPELVRCSDVRGKVSEKLY